MEKKEGLAQSSGTSNIQRPHKEGPQRPAREGAAHLEDEVTKMPESSVSRSKGLSFVSSCGH